MQSDLIEEGSAVSLVRLFSVGNMFVEHLPFIILYNYCTIRPFLFVFCRQERGDLTKSSPRLKRNRSITFDSSSPSSSSIPSMSPIEEKPNSEPRQKVTTSTPEKLPSLGGPNTSDDAFGPSITPPSTPSKTPNLHRRLSRTGSYGYRQVR